MKVWDKYKKWKRGKEEVEELRRSSEIRKLEEERKELVRKQTSLNKLDELKADVRKKQFETSKVGRATKRIGKVAKPIVKGLARGVKNYSDKVNKNTNDFDVWTGGSLSKGSSRRRAKSKKSSKKRYAKKRTSRQINIWTGKPL